MRYATSILILLLTLPGAVQAQPSGSLVSNQAAAADVEIAGVKTGVDGTVHATVKNKTKGTIKDVKLLVTHSWYWKHEMRPGADNPGRSSYGMIPSEIAPGGSVAFDYAPSPPLPQRDDGSFDTTVAIQSFTQVGP